MEADSLEGLEKRAAAIDRLAESGRPEEAIQQRGELIVRLRKAPQARVLLAQSLVKQASALMKADMPKEALVLAHEVVERFFDIGDSSTLPPRATAQWLICLCSYQIGNYQESAAAADALAADSAVAADGQIMAGALMQKAHCLAGDKLGRPELQRALLDEVVSRFGGIEAPWARFAVAEAMFEQGRLLSEMGERERALARWGDVFERYAADPPLGAGLPLYAQAAKINLLAEGRDVEAVLAAAECLAEQLELIKAGPVRLRPSASLRSPSRAVLRAAIAGEEAGRLREALALFTGLYKMFLTDSDPEVQSIGVRALVNAITVLARLGDFSDAASRAQLLAHAGASALEELEQLASRAEDSEPMQFGWARLTRAVVLEELGRDAEARENLVELIDQLRGDGSPLSELLVATASESLARISRGG